MKAYLPFLISGFIALTSTAQADWVVPPDSQVLQVLAPGTTELMPSHLSFLTWNIQKAQGAAQWQQDFQNLAADRQLTLLQEGVEEPLVLDTLRSISSFGWLMARTFFMETDHKATGIITGALQEAWSSVFLRTKDTEPFANTPKMALLTTYQMQDGSRLLVANVHAINFTSLEPFRRQMDEIAGLIQGWQGRVVFAGDFNTWNPDRTAYLQSITSASGLSEVAIPDDPRKLKLDHIFVRGCTAAGTQIHGQITSSDHFPITTELLCAN